LESTFGPYSAHNSVDVATVSNVAAAARTWQLNEQLYTLQLQLVGIFGILFYANWISAVRS